MDLEDSKNALACVYFAIKIYKELKETRPNNSDKRKAKAKPKKKGRKR